MSIDWKKEISILVYVKQVISDLDINHLWQYHLPAVATTKEEIKKLEEYLGFQLDSKYVEFLLYANGWKSFYQSVDLFGTYDLLGSESMQNARRMLNSIDDIVMNESGLLKDDLLPIAATSMDSDIFLISKFKPEEIIWFSGQEIDRFPNFNEFFLAMVDYNRAEVEDLKRDISQKN